MSVFDLLRQFLIRTEGMLGESDLGIPGDPLTSPTARYGAMHRSSVFLTNQQAVLLFFSCTLPTLSTLYPPLA